MKHAIKAAASFLLFTVIVHLSGCSGSVSPELGQYKQDLKYHMQEMINVLNAGHRTEFMEKYVDPAYVSKMGGVSAAVTQFTDRRSQALQAALRVAKNVQPTYDAANKQMTYFNELLQIPIVFKMKDGKWYLQDDYFRI